MFPTAAPEAAPAPPVYWSQSAQAAVEPWQAAPERATGGRSVLLALLAVLVVAALGVGGWLVLRGQQDAGGAGTSAGSSATETAAPGPEVGDVQQAAGIGYTVEAVQVEETCLGHAYGDTADFFTGTDCTGLSRALYSAVVDAEPVVVSVVRVQMPDPAAARALQTMTDRVGSGNVSDLLREGVRYTGSPAELSGAEYASAVAGSGVTIVESAWVDENAMGTSARMDQVAEAALALRVRPFPGE